MKEVEEKTPTRIKVGYALNMDDLRLKTAFAIVGHAVFPAVTTAAIMSGGEPTLVAAATASAVATAAIYAAADYTCANNFDLVGEAIAFDRYVEAKHTQMALKKLAKNLEKQDAKEKEAGKGVKAAVIAKAGYAR